MPPAFQLHERGMGAVPVYFVRWSTVSVHEPFAYLERARVADALGRAAEARDYYERFLWLYDSPGASHQHLLEEARSSLVRLR